MVACPKVGIVNHEIGLSPFLSERQFFSHVFVVVERKTFEFCMHAYVPLNYIVNA
jgi:hypothetical protein